MAQKLLCTAVLVLHLLPQFFAWDLIRIFDALPELRFKGAHLFVVFAFRTALQ